MINPDHAAFLARHHRGVFVTMRRAGRPQLSNVVYAFDGTHVRISVTDDRAKTHNARRDDRVALHVTNASFGQYVVADGRARVAGPVASLRDHVSLELEDLYRAVSGEHPDWDDFHRAMLADGRAVISFTVDHTYGQV